MYLVADVAIPTQKFQFISLVLLLEALYTIKGFCFQCFGDNYLKHITKSISF
ncbi:hypothetical protein RhiirA4_481201 [Rhizophagus irregularis]|uniref:Uncharacterized protein n=1 Tax=Rhizophagus irregularis TaxID=588596 RepID=A0A2I1HJ48_9GLOM|nr:hypothetical protein RhiirA4_481201 [Rhizophagus irregularis]